MPLFFTASKFYDLNSSSEDPMPKFICTTADTDETVVRPVILDVVRHVMKVTGLDEAKTPIFFPGTENATFQPGSSLSTDSLQNRVRSAFTNQVAVEVDEQYEHDRILSTAVFRPDNLFIFRDDHLETSIRPTYSSTEVTINLRFRAQDKTTAIRWRDDLRQRVSMGRMTYLHELTYSYFIPPEMLVILQEIHRMREAVAGFGEDWDTYFKNTASPKVTKQVGLDGNNAIWSMPETQMRVVGYFDFDGAPEQGSREEGGDTWTISVGYKFKYDKPVACVMFYPLMIHNQLMDQKYRPDTLPYQVEHQQRSYSWSAGAFRYFESSYPLVQLAKQDGVFVPNFDEFIPNSVIPETMRVITLLFNLDPANPTLLNLETDLGGYQFDPDIVTFLKSEAPYMTKPYRSVFNLSLYENKNLMAPDWLAVDGNLNVTSTKPLSYRHYYHLRLSLIEDLSMLDPGAKDRLQNHCSAAVRIMDTLDPTLKDRGLLPVCMPGDWLSNSDLKDSINIINRPVISRGNSQEYGMKTVETLFITTRNN
jgi:hypothetical protein